MLPVVTAEEMRALDRATIDVIGIPALALMETAGRAVAEAALRMFERGHVAVICGPGNNGGDGFVCARVLRDRGVDAVVYLAVPRDKVGGDARAHLDIYERAGGVILTIATPAALAEHRVTIEHAALVIDALFGIGTLRPISGHVAEVIACINAAAQCLAVDIPSGVDSDTGAATIAVTATRTVTMGAAKIGLVSAPGFARAGSLQVCDIGIPAMLMATASVRAGLVEERDVRAWLPASGPLDHKGTRGHAVIIGGEMRGAGRLSADAALRSGAGLVTLASDGDAASDAVIVRAIHGTQLDVLVGGKQAVVIGPGLGQSAIARARVHEVLALGVPAVLDADALNLLAEEPAAIAKAAGPVVITPHPGEAARLLATTVAAIEADRLAAARALATLTHAIVVLKGARTVICDGTLGDDFCAINPTGAPSLATGGSGDVLAGVIAGLLAQRVAPCDAACAAVFVHGRAGEALFATHGRGAIASDLPVAIARVLADFSLDNDRSLRRVIGDAAARVVP